MPGSANAPTAPATSLPTSETEREAFFGACDLEKLFPTQERSKRRGGSEKKKKMHEVTQMGRELVFSWTAGDTTSSAALGCFSASLISSDGSDLEPAPFRRISEEKAQTSNTSPRGISQSVLTMGAPGGARVRTHAFTSKTC